MQCNHFILSITKLFLLIFFIITQNKSNFAQTSTSCKLKNKTTFDGEKLNYKVFYTLSNIYVPAGEAVFSNNLKKLNHNVVFHLKGEGHTYPSYDWFFKVKDLYESYVDTSTMLPYQFSRNVQEGKNRINTSAYFDRDKNKINFESKEIPISGCVQDVLSMIYYARNIDYENYQPNDLIPYQLFLDDKVYNSYIRYLGKQIIRTKQGVYSCFKIKPKLFEGTIFKGGEGMTVYVSTDNNKIPIYIETPILVGKIKVYYQP